MFQRSIWAAILYFSSTAAALAGCGGVDLIPQLPTAELARIGAAAEADPYGRGNMWKATRDGRTIWLIGTIHLHDDRLDPVAAALAETVAGSDLVMMELDRPAMQVIDQAPARDPDRFFFRQGDTLPAILGQEKWAEVQAALSDLGVPGFFAAQFRPWFLNMTLMATPCMVRNQTAGLQGLDMMILEITEQAAVPVAALDNAEALLDLFEDGTQEEHLRGLDIALADRHRADALIATTVENYFAQTHRLVWEFTLLELEKSDTLSAGEKAEMAAEMYDKLLVRRNLDWIEQIVAAAQAHDTVTVAVGVLHLSSDMGLPRLLSERGFAVERAGAGIWPDSD